MFCYNHKTGASLPYIFLHLNQTSGIIFKQTHTDTSWVHFIKQLGSPCCWSSRICRIAALIIFLSSYSLAARSFTQTDTKNLSTRTTSMQCHAVSWVLAINTHHFRELIDVLDWLQLLRQDVQVVAGLWPEREQDSEVFIMEVIMTDL